ncbi:GH-E family nuclease [Tsukamurella tyrosinosolvens]|uniref:GH-E family nuclease n=1 Tax=Tsukamurella tyrosinosolvens TaxID=57704 RepID=UPI003B969DB1
MHTVWNALENRWETYRLVKWEPGDKPRPWDMGHTAKNEYRKLHDDYLRGPENGGITEKQFLERDQNTDFYEASTPERNSSHIDEDMTPLPPRP